MGVLQPFALNFPLFPPNAAGFSLLALLCGFSAFSPESHRENKIPFPSVLPRFSGRGRLTEHGLQAHQAADEAVEVQGQVGLRVARDDQLVQLFVQLVAFLG